MSALRVLRRAFATSGKQAEAVSTGLCFELTPEQKEIQQLARQVSKKQKKAKKKKKKETVLV